MKLKMLTKRQALEFIYNISQHSRKVNLIMFSGILEVDYFEDTLGYDYKGYGEPYSLEDMVKQFIIENDGTQILQELDEIPIDVDMLEVGQTYKVIFNEAQVTDELTQIDNNNVYFRRNYPIKIQSIREIYKVNEHANM